MNFTSSTSLKIFQNNVTICAPFSSRTNVSTVGACELFAGIILASSKTCNYHLRLSGCLQMLIQAFGSFLSYILSTCWSLSKPSVDISDCIAWELSIFFNLLPAKTRFQHKTTNSRSQQIAERLQIESTSNIDSYTIYVGGFSKQIIWARNLLGMKQNERQITFFSSWQPNANKHLV